MNPLPSNVDEDKPSPEPPKKGLFDRLSSFHQKALLIMGFAYAFGYASRALHAFESNFGALPGVRFDYLVAGTLLLIPPVTLCLTCWGAWRSAKHLAAWSAKAPERTTRVSRVLVGAFMLPLVMILFLERRALWVVMAFVTCAFAYFVMFLCASGESSEPPSEGTSTKRQRRILSWLGSGAIYVWGGLMAFIYGVLLLMLFSMALAYGTVVLMHVPQEFGGVKPKWGVLDLSSDQLSPELRSVLASPSEHHDPSARVIRSRPLEVYTTSEPWLVRLPSTTVGVPARSIRLDGKAILSVEWCQLQC